MSRSTGRAVRAIVGVIAALLLGSVPAPGRAQDGPSYYVLCIGINKYEIPSMHLRGCVNDANAVESLFKRQGARVRVRKLLDDEAPTHKIMDALKKMEDEVEPDDIVVVYLSGHGGRERGRWEFAPSDYGVTGIGIPGSILLGPIDTLIHRGHRVLLMIDACHAGQIGHNTSVESHLTGQKFHSTESNAFYRGGLVLMAACTPSQSSKDGTDNSMFTKAMLEALNGRADLDRDGTVTLKEVKTYLFWRVSELEHRQEKYPGMAWPPDQDYVCVASNSIPESFVMARVDGVKPLLPGDDRLRPRNARPLEVAPGSSPVGHWRLVQRLVKADGSPLLDSAGRNLLHIYDLELRADNTYTAMVTRPERDRMETRTTNGRYFYQRNSLFNIGTDGMRIRPHFSLGFDNGSDELKLESLTDDEMRIEAYPEPSDQLPTKYTLTRVKGGAGTQ